MSLTRKVAYNTTIQIVGKIITTGISLILVAALTRYLGVVGYGKYTTIFAFLAFFGVLADFGFFWILIREIANPKVDLNKSASNILTLRTVLGIVVFGLAYLVSLLIPQYRDFQAGIGIIALASLFLALNSTYIGIFQNQLRMDKAVLTDILGRAIILAVTLYFIRLGLGLNLILWAYAIGNFVNLLASAYLGRSHFLFRPAFDLAYWKKVFWQALPMGIVVILNVIYFRIDTLMLSLMRTSQDVGIYGPPYKVLEILLFFPGIFMGNVFPIITRYIYAKDQRLEGAIQKSFDFLLILGIPIVMGIIFTASRIIRIVAGQDFVNAHTIPPVLGLSATSPTALQILVVAVGVSFLSHLFGYLVVALGKQVKLIVPNLILVVFNIGLNLILIPRISYIGAALVTVLTEILVLVFSWYIARRVLEFRIQLNILWQVTFAGLILLAFLYFWANSLNLIILVPSAAFVYFGALGIVGGIKREMILQVLSFKK